PWKATRDAPVVQAPVLPRVVLAATAARLGERGKSPLRVSGLRRDSPVRRIDHEPRAASLHVEVLEPVERAPQPPAAPAGFGARIVALVRQRVELLGREVVE